MDSTAAVAIRRPGARAEALTGLVTHLSHERQGPVLAEALASASTVGRKAVLDVILVALRLEGVPKLAAATISESLLRVWHWWP